MFVPPTSPFVVVLRGALWTSLALAAACSGGTEPGNGGDVQRIEVTPSRSALAADQRVQLRATPKDEAGQPVPDVELAWVSADTLVAIVSEDGEVTGRGAGTAEVSATVAGVAGKATIEIAANPVPAIAALQPASVLAGSQGFTLVVRGDRFARGSVIHWNGTPRPTTHRGWRELRAEIGAADVAARGTAAVTVVAPGPGGGASPPRTLEISTVPVASVTVTPNPASVAAGETLPLLATARDDQGQALPGRTVAWASANAAVATVSEQGEVRGVARGTTTITATVEGKVAQVAFTVGAPSQLPALTGLQPAIAVAGDPAPELVVRGSGFAASATAKWNGAARATRIVSASELRVQLLAADLASAGSARVTVDVAGGESNALAFAISAGVTSVEVTGARVLWPSEVVQLGAVARDAQGRTLPGRTVTWQSGTTSVALVDPTGLVQAQAAGQSVMSASVDGVRGTAMLHVLPKPEADLVYQATRGNRTTLLVVRPGEDQWPAMLFADGRHALDPAVSPDGQWIAFTSLGEGNNSDIWVARRDGSGLRRLTTHAAIDEQPAWSPDGRMLAFRSDRDGLGDIWIMNADGTGLANVTRNAPGFGTAPSSFQPAWSPDGTRLVFAEGDEETIPFRSQIVSVRTDGSDKRVLTNAAGYSDGAPTWSPDGRTIAIERRAVGSAVAQLQLIGADGREVLLPYELGPGTAPAWSRDGQWLAFTHQGDVYVTRLGDGVRRRVTEGHATGGGVAPDWFPR